MKMIAASKLRSAQPRVENSRGLWQPFTALLGDTPCIDVKKNVIVAVTSDKGLCGSIHSASVNISELADTILKNVEFDAIRIVFNKFRHVVIHWPTVATILSPEVVERESEAGGMLGDLDSYEIEGGETKSEVLQNLVEFQFACVRLLILIS
ncbi:ATP synthase subunit gamma, mitochondrial [Ananas comosus]|uniref:ATP synthase subunit gamma, mitochondrial n=1 Tax=Ananas comosus TaxID=4615 RepID=A0A199VWG6_ANACO|nr:ATP synthase subunit gamma, mitochondrial [Ananas comosus]